MNKRVYVYCRVSSAEQVNGYSLGEQEDRVRKYCDSLGWTVIDVFVDGGYSGASTNRPALSEMIEKIKEGKVDCVVVYKLDRLSRSQKDTLALIEDVFLANHTDFVSITENFDTSTPFGKAMIGILSVFAQLERETIKERMSIGREARAKEGKWNGGGYVPFGYEYIDGQLIVNDFEALQVREVFDRFNSGDSLNQIMKDFDSIGYSHLLPKHIKYILNNKVYLGYIRFNEEWFKAPHQPIIDEDTFNKAQTQLYRRQEVFGSERRTPTTYLGGLIYCKKCGARYGKARSGDDKYGRHINYTCYSRNKKSKHMMKAESCDNKSYRVEELDNIVFNEIRKLKLEPIPIHVPDNNNDNILKEIKSIDSQIDRFLDLYGTGRFSVEQLDAKILPLEDKKRKLKLSLDAKVIDVIQIENDINSFEDILENGTFDEIRSILFALIDRIDIDGEDIEIHWSFS